MLSAQEMSRRYAMYLAAQLAGDDTEGLDFGLWLDAHWHDEIAFGDELCGPDQVDAVSTHRVIVWSELDDEIIGVLAGRAHGCFRIARDARPPEIALMLDDAVDCSTGSILQERAFADRRDVVIDAAVPVARTLIVPGFPVTAEIPHLPPPDTTPPFTPDAGI